MMFKTQKNKKCEVFMVHTSSLKADMQKERDGTTSYPCLPGPVWYHVTMQSVLVGLCTCGIGPCQASLVHLGQSGLRVDEESSIRPS